LNLQAGSREGDNEPFVSTKGGEFINQMNDSQFSGKTLFRGVS